VSVAVGVDNLVRAETDRMFAAASGGRWLGERVQAQQHWPRRVTRRSAGALGVFSRTLAHVNVVFTNQLGWLLSLYSRPNLSWEVKTAIIDGW
jgi:hypothetical protein